MGRVSLACLAVIAALAAAATPCCAVELTAKPRLQHFSSERQWPASAAVKVVVRRHGHPVEAEAHSDGCSATYRDHRVLVVVSVCGHRQAALRAAFISLDGERHGFRLSYRRVR